MKLLSYTCFSGKHKTCNYRLCSGFDCGIDVVVTKSNIVLIHLCRKAFWLLLVVGLHPAHYLSVLIKGEKIRAKGTARIFFATLDVARHM